MLKNEIYKIVQNIIKKMKQKKMGIPLEKKYVEIKGNKLFNYKIMLNRLKKFWK